MPVSIPAEVRGKFYALRALAFALFVLAGAAFYLRPNSFGVLTLGLLGIAVGGWLVRRSNARVRQARGQAAGAWSPAAAVKRVGPLAWTLTGMSLVACVIFYFAMYVDALHGGREGWPALAFGGAVLALAGASGYVAMKIFR
jgi:hypothetical protein